MHIRASKVLIGILALLMLLLAPSVAIAQQTLDDALQPENAQGSGTDMLKKAFWLIVFVGLPISGIALAAYGLLVKGGRHSQWLDGFGNVVAGLVLVLLPAIIGFLMDVNLFEMFGAN